MFDQKTRGDCLVSIQWRCRLKLISVTISAMLPIDPVRHPSWNVDPAKAAAHRIDFQRVVWTYFELMHENDRMAEDVSQELFLCWWNNCDDVKNKQYWRWCIYTGGDKANEKVGCGGRWPRGDYYKPMMSSALTGWKRLFWLFDLWEVFEFLCIKSSFDEARSTAIRWDG